MIKEIGKIKKGTCFIYNDRRYIITKSGFGTGKYVSVEFQSIGTSDLNTYSLPKKMTVETFKP